ncbi:hypothetical protein BW716_02220 [[Flexibacter] sp. ATCC 35208]|nr:hypothetical protein BW716_02220 [[Flexibacter] sp. ATCC 35208]
MEPDRWLCGRKPDRNGGSGDELKGILKQKEVNRKRNYAQVNGSKLKQKWINGKLNHNQLIRRKQIKAPVTPANYMEGNPQGLKLFIFTLSKPEL